MRVALLTPLPPARTGIAHYASMLIPALAKEIELEAFGSPGGWRRGDFDLAIHQLGNNPHHEWIYREALEHPGIAVLHDVVLHHLIVEMTLARGDAGAYVQALEANHGEEGAAWARGRAAGLHSEMGNFLLPASVQVANRSRAVIVHNEWAAARLESFGVTRPIHVVPHPYVPDPVRHDRDAVRRRLGIAENERVIGFFGFVTSAKRAEVVLEAFAKARALRPSLRLLIVGEAAPNIDPDSLRGEGVTVTGYVADEEFGLWYTAADRVVNLRYPSAGETSGTLIRAFAHGKPVAVSGYAQFAEYPDTIAVKIPFGSGEVEAVTRFMLDDVDERAIAAAQREWLERNATLERTVDGYIRAIWSASAPWAAPSPPPKPLIPLFPKLEVTGASGGSVTIRNAGQATIATRVYGFPAYRLIAKLRDGWREVESRWIELPRDLPPGGETTVAVPWRSGLTLELHHALEGIPTVDAGPWYVCEV